MSNDPRAEADDADAEDDAELADEERRRLRRFLRSTVYSSNFIVLLRRQGNLEKMDGNGSTFF